MDHLVSFRNIHTFHFQLLQFSFSEHAAVGLDIEPGNETEVGIENENGTEQPGADTGVAIAAVLLAVAAG